MPSERIQRQIDALLDQAEAAIARREWQALAETARAVLAIDEENQDAGAFLKMAAANGIDATAPAVSASPATTIAPPAPQPTSFANGRYEVKRFLGEGGKKKVYLAHDALLDRDIAFSLIKIEGLDETGRERVMRERAAWSRPSVLISAKATSRSSSLSCAR